MHELEGWSISLSVLVMLGIFWFVLTELLTLRTFRRVHHADTWQGAEKPCSNAEVDDPFLALMGKMRLMRPRLRGRGGFEAPEEDCAEPARTERALRRAFCWSPRWPWRWCCKGDARAGDVLETLPMWTEDAGEGKGIYYLYVQFLIQLIIAIQVGFLFAHSFNVTSAGGLFNLVSILVWQSALVVWVASYTARPLHSARQPIGIRRRAECRLPHPRRQFGRRARRRRHGAADDRP